MDRRPITLLAALMLALALCAPAWAQDEEAGTDETTVEAQGVEEGGDESGEDVEASGVDESEGNNGVDDVNCRDFDFQEDAQEFFDRNGGIDGEDEDRLDEDPGEDDGIACEDLPSRDDDSDSGATPSGGVDSGMGGTAPKPASAIAPLILGGVAGAVVLLGTGVAARRRA